MSKKKIYLASSWRNKEQPELVSFLRGRGHEVYDFRNPTEGNHGFNWSQIDKYWKSWSTGEYRDALKHPIAQDGFAHDRRAMEWADTFVLLLPSGRSAHLEAGWAMGRGIPTAVFLENGTPMEPELMYLLAGGDPIVTSYDELDFWLEWGEEFQWTVEECQK